MTQAEFIAYVQIPVNVPNVNIWYTETAPYIISGITIPTLDANLQNITAFLDQVQELTVPIEIAGSQIDITLTIDTREVYYTPNGNFYFFIVDPYVVGSITEPSFNGTSATVAFTPAIDANVFNESPYNVLQGAANNTRKSDYIMFSDRYKVGTVGLPGYTGPTNIDAILSGSAQKADVQDSLYSDTGWVNGRYQGTKTDMNDYQVDPAVRGNVFKAAEFPISYEISQIQYQASQSLAIYSDYFNTGTKDTPGIQATAIAHLVVSGSNYDSNSPILYVSSSLGDPKPYLPAIGDTIAFNGSAGVTLGNDYEIVKVEEVYLHTLTPTITYGLVVSRRYRGTPENVIQNPGITTPSNGDTLYNIKPSQICEIKSNKIVALRKGLLLVEGTGNILTLDNYGYVVKVQ